MRSADGVAVIKGYRVGVAGVRRNVRGDETDRRSRPY
jgi:hypothetical protein